MNAAIIDARDARVYSSSASIDSERFHAELRTADYRLALPLSTLMAGEYLLRLEALLDGGVPVSRSARFTVR